MQLYVAMNLRTKGGNCAVADALANIKTQNSHTTDQHGRAKLR